MIPTAKILWGEGLFLRPQHFQQQDTYHEWRSVQTARNLHPYAWGLRKIEVDPDALKAGQLRVVDLQAVMPDGEFYNAPAEDDLPTPVALEDAFGPDSQASFHLSMSPVRSIGANVAATREAADTGVRYFSSPRNTGDMFTNAVAAEVTTLRKSVRLLPDRTPHGHLETLVTLRVRRTPSGSFELDPHFIPPCLTIGASPHLHQRLRRLLDVLQAKVEALYGFHREPTKNIIEFRSGDVASFWLLHTASTAYAGLGHFMRHPGLHPERLFQRLLELAGSLLTFSKSYALANLPAYDHADPGPNFLQLDDIIRDLLEAVISTRYFAIVLSEVRPSFHQGRLDAQQITAGTSLYLGVAASLPAAEIVDAVPMRIKIGAPEDVEKIVLSALPGVPLTHAPQVPAAIPVRPGTYYFAIESRGPLYERMLQAQAVTLYVPSGIPDVKLELIAVNP